ncbi:hypothetical protein SDC9_04257 [bioreactor metagenome]|uniref:DUF370 domain-containing protein n=1 Tax=bioreactor metagenome TaxID=1076179 RepID=A0A644SVS0_9ZZZZ|nr:DUF370 domain-containing protein [Negativicutes bacterium]
MFLHLGADTVIPLSEVIAITDLKSVRSSINRKFLNNSRDNNKVIDISSNNPKSFIVTKKVVYLSAISSLTLKKRAGYFPEAGEDDDI